MELQATSKAGNRAILMLLHLVDSWFGAIRNSYTTVRGKKELNTIFYYPEITDVDVLSDIVNRASWYLPRSELSGIKVFIAVSRDLLDTDLRTLTPPLWQENYIQLLSSVELTERKNYCVRDSDVIMVWDKTALVTPQLIPKWHKVCIVDPTFYSYVESHNHRSIFARSLLSDRKEQLLQQSKNNYEKLLNKVSGMKKGYVFGTGPSIEKAWDHDFNDGFTAVCNSIVRNRKLLSHIMPDLLVFADPVFHFSPSRYSAEFRRHMMNAVTEFGCFVMVPELNLPLMVSHFPSLKEKIIGMPSKRSTYNFPTVADFSVKSTDNIMTFLMLPVASSIAEEIYILACDGRKPGDVSFWRHGETVQFEELMQTVSQTHPSFFRDRNYSDYYSRHCQELEEMLEYGEKLGRKYYSLSSSRIPALIDRSL